MTTTHSTKAEIVTTNLGNSDLELTSIGFGAWAIGGGEYAFGWGGQEDNDSIAAIQKAIDVGVNWIDTAAIYGLGHSEEVVGGRSRSWMERSRMCLPSARCDGMKSERSIEV